MVNEWSYWRHLPDGEIYALYGDVGEGPIKVVGPLAYPDVTQSHLTDGWLDDQRPDSRKLYWAYEELSKGPDVLEPLDDAKIADVQKQYEERLR